MPAMQERATELQNASAKEFEQLRTRSRELRLRTSDLQAREQQLRESRLQTPAGPDRAAVDRQWLNVRHEITASTLELEGINERMSDLRVQREQAAREQAARDQAARDQAAREQAAREQAARAVTVVPTRASEPAAAEVSWLADAGRSMLILVMAPILIVLVYRLFVRNSSRDANALDSSARFQRMEQAIEAIAMDVERIAEGQRFTTRILAERHPDSASRAQGVALVDPERTAP
jgi:hypothetical protein